MTLNDFDIWYRSRYRRTSSFLTSTAFVIADLFAVMLSFGGGFFWVNLYDMSAINFKSFVTYWPYLPAFILVFQVMGAYPGVALAPSEGLRRFTIASIMTHGGIIFSRFVEDKEFDAISVAFIISCCFSIVILLICRAGMQRILRKTRLGGIPAVIYGGGETGRTLVNHLLREKNTGYIPVLILDDDPATGDEYQGIPILHDTETGPEIVSRFNIKMAIIAMPGVEQKVLTRILSHSVSAFRYNVLIPDFFEVTNIWMSVRDFNGILGLATSHKLQMFWNLWIKRALDIVVVIFGGIVVLPFLLLIALIVKLDSPGPALFGHTRLGKNGRPFKAYKFRSMTIDAEARLKALLESDPEIRREWELNQKIKNDPRITGVGSFLRRTSLDEFPQIINVLRGEMSLVGPRPIVDAEVAKYGENYDRIFSVLPGVSGLWQVSGRSDSDYAERIAYDTYYLQSWSLWLDLWILLKTVEVVFKGKGAY
ncbi:undecaprenyl-phosphate galactose phosphotransferase WbaP [Spirochaetia bacterium]|nr:undecaprenyl-phosphate galactose phosphotransferase WbaP [Spirochaetia bacterium]